MWVYGSPEQSSHITASSVRHQPWMTAHHQPPPVQCFAPVLPSGPWGLWQWIIRLQLHHNITAGIYVALFFSDTSLCEVRCSVVCCCGEFRGWLTRKESLHSPFPLCANWNVIWQSVSNEAFGGEWKKSPARKPVCASEMWPFLRSKEKLCILQSCAWQQVGIFALKAQFFVVRLQQLLLEIVRDSGVIKRWGDGHYLFPDRFSDPCKT